MKPTRKRIRILILAAVVVAACVPVGFALSLESSPARGSMPIMRNFEHTPLRGVPDAALLFGLGTVLIGLAVAVRRAA